MEGKLFFSPSERSLVLASWKQQKPFFSNSQAFRRHLVLPPPPYHWKPVTSSVSTANSARRERENQSHVTSEMAQPSFPGPAPADAVWGTRLKYVRHFHVCVDFREAQSCDL